jgi:hypothetical protein
LPSNFSGRPLRDTAADRRRFVDRVSDLEALKRALSLHFNVLALGEAGVGMTTLLNRLVGELYDAVRINAEACESAVDLFALVLEARDGALIDLPDGYGSRKVLADLESRVSRETVVVVDRLAPVIAHDIFGRMRDELWELDARWLLAERKEDAPVVTTPPADAFFDVTHTVPPLALDEVIELLDLRDEDQLLPHEVRVRIAERCEGNPRDALRLARLAVLSGSQAVFGESAAATLLDRVRGELGNPAARLAEELAAGPAGPSDDALRTRMGWSQPRLYEVFRQLEQAGYVTRSDQRNGRVGRPRAVYALNEGGPE